MIVASIRIATASPIPISLKSMKERVANTLNTMTITIAALVTVPAEPAIPLRTASSVLMPRS